MQLKESFMASSNADQLSERDRKLYEQLDGFSSTLRHTAERFADFLMQFKMQSAEVGSLIKALDAIIISPIETIDLCIFDLEKSISTINSQLARRDVISPLLSETKFIEFAKLNEEMAMRTAELAEKAMQLNSHTAP